MVGAGAYAERPLSELSGGEQQRLLIAQALVAGPRLLLLDEPLDSLDLPNQAAVAALVGRICREAGVAVVLVAHDVNPLLPYLDRVAYLAAGRAVVGPVAEVITTPDAERALRGARRGAACLRRAAGGDRAARAARRTTTTATRMPGSTARPSMPTEAPAPSWNPLRDVSQLLEYHFMINALLAGSAVAVMAALVGWMMVLRRETFAGHTLAMMAFPGAAAAALAGVPAALGYLLFCGGGRARDRAPARRERAPGARRRRASASCRRWRSALGLPVREPLRRRARRPREPAVRRRARRLRRRRWWCWSCVALAVIAVLAAIGRPLLLSSVDAPLAAARGVPVRRLALAFLACSRSRSRRRAR